MLPRQRRERLEGTIRAHVARVSRHPLEHLDASTLFSSLGFDSLMALEVKTALERVLGLPLPVSLVWNYQTIGAVASFIAQEMGLDIDGPANAAEWSSEPQTAIAGLSDAGALNLLAGRLAARE